MERMLISGVALDRNADRISVIGIQDVPGSAFKLFNTLAKRNINVDIIIQSVGREGTKDISFTVSSKIFGRRLSFWKNIRMCWDLKEWNITAMWQNCPS